MASLVVEPMSTATEWVAVSEDGVTPSSALAMHDEQTIVGHGTDGVSARVTATAAAQGHALRRTLPAVDLSLYSELRLSVRSDRRAGAGGLPFTFELRLGSVEKPVTAPGNTWHRLLPVRGQDRWETLRLGITDLDTAVAAALTQLQLRCVDSTTPTTLYVDDLIAVRPRMLADADRALEARFQGMTVGNPAVTVPVKIRTPSEPRPTAPALDIMHINMDLEPNRVRDGRQAADFTADGARLTPFGDPYSIDYAITPVAGSRTEQAALIEAVLDRLPAFDELNADGERLPVALLPLSRAERFWPTVGGSVPVLLYRVEVRASASFADGRPVHGVSDVRVGVDQVEERSVGEP